MGILYVSLGIYAVMGILYVALGINVVMGILYAALGIYVVMGILYVINIKNRIKYTHNNINTKRHI
jgi:heme A synthase